MAHVTAPPGTMIQMDNSGHSVACYLLTTDVAPHWPGLYQLEQFIQGLVLYDGVVLPGIPTLDYAPELVTPQRLWSDGAFTVEIECSELDRRCSVDSLVDLRQASSDHLPAEDPHVHLPVPGPALLHWIDRILAERGPEWPSLFWGHVVFFLQMKEDYARRTVRWIVAQFRDPRWGNVGSREKVGIYYLYHSFFNVLSCVQKHRAYLPNYYRMPLVNEAYRCVRRLAAKPRVWEDYLPNAHSLMELGLTDELPDPECMSWALKGPFFLARILDTVDRREQIVEAILELRHSGAARRFREAHRQLVEELGSETALHEINEKMDRLVQNFRRVSSPVEIPLSVNLPVVPKNLPGPWVWGAKRTLYRICRHPLQIVTDTLDVGAMRRISRNIEKVFGCTPPLVEG